MKNCGDGKLQYLVEKLTNSPGYESMSESLIGLEQTERNLQTFVTTLILYEFEFKIQNNRICLIDLRIEWGHARNQSLTNQIVIL